MLLSVDPGLRSCGIATWDHGGRLERAMLILNPNGAEWVSMVGAVTGLVGTNYRLVIELPQVYVASRSKGDPNDLILLAGLVGSFAHRFAAGGYTLIKPAQWKGQTPKAITEERARKRLTPEELARVQFPKAKSLRHNVWDAIGIGLKHLSRQGY